MPAMLSGGKFQKINVDELAALLQSVTPARQINAVHLHHTWKPRHHDYRGYDTIVGMWRFHTVTQGWKDIAQHLTIAPDGSLWTGRHWDLPPASAVGHNGSAQAGPFMIEMIGDFDVGGDPFVDPQRSTAIAVLAALVDRFSLSTEAIRFHNEMSTKTCPGTAIDRHALLDEVAARRGHDAGGARAAAPASPFAPDADALFQAMTFLRGDGAARSWRELDAAFYEPWDAEPPEVDQHVTALRQAAAVVDAAAVTRADVDVELTPAVKEALRPYVINLTRGRFSTEGIFTTSQADVEAIFSQHLPKALADAAREQRPLRIVIYAHGGLVGERDGLGVALKHVHWWVRNGVYPLYFVWETGLLSSLVNVILASLARGGARAERDFTDFADAQIEGAAREFRARSFWADMKHVAELSSAPGGGARFVAEKLASFSQAHPDAVEMHAVGHSAGSNFHGFFLPVLFDAGLPGVKTLQLLAPAITVDAFLDTIMRRIRQIGELTMFTMKDTSERADNCANIYRKSLLYLIHHALEDAREMPLLGLQISVLDDIRLKRLFGVEGRVTSRTDTVVWSPSTDEDLRAASTSERHGGFDDDPATMNSVLRRVAGLSGSDPVRDPFVAPATRRDVDEWSSPAAAFDVATGGAPTRDVPFDYARTDTPGTRVLTAHADRSRNGAGRRRALCVGINAYRRKPLRGCVADAQAWARTLVALGFDTPQMLLDQQATRDRILGDLDAMVRSSRPGDVVVFQFAGHGTAVPDRSADELGGDSPDDDEALCPIDFTEGRLVVDDDLAAIFQRIPDGVHVTAFIDCCHSGSITRFGAGPPRGQGRGDLDERSRYIDADEQIIEGHLAFRAARGGARLVDRESRAAARDILFAACRSTEVAWESNGQGDFTRHATRALADGVAGLTNAAFLARVQASFGDQPRQHPELHPPGVGALGLLTPTMRGDVEAALSVPAPPAGRAGDVADLLRAIADVLGTR
ncbi:MAG: peptidase C14 [Luteitalea sp.]|nr:peptidase C14 [Luteitalea sp.]